MSIKRYSGADFAEVSSRRRWNGSSWVALTSGKRWSGSAWVNLWSGSQGGSSGGFSSGGSDSGVLFSDLKSTVSSPTVHYSASYSASRSGDSLSVALTVKGWLTSSASRLGNGIKLTVYAQVNGGAWVSSVIKPSISLWNDATKHSVLLHLNGNDAARSKIELYVTRSGSSYGGSAGNLGSAKKPKSYYIHL